MVHTSAPRRLASILAVGLLLAACSVTAPSDPAPHGAPPPGDPPPDETPTPTPPPPDGVAAQLLALVNAARAEGRDCGVYGTLPPTHPLTLEARLTAAAQDHAADMDARTTMSHTGGDGSDPGDRIARTGYVAASWGENVAYGYPTPEAVMEGWLGSDGHCDNLMHPGFTEFGAGESDRFWAQVFARPY